MKESKKWIVRNESGKVVERYQTKEEAIEFVADKIGRVFNIEKEKREYSHLEDCVCKNCFQAYDDESEESRKQRADIYKYNKFLEKLKDKELKDKEEYILMKRWGMDHGTYTPSNEDLELISKKLSKENSQRGTIKEVQRKMLTQIKEIPLFESAVFHSEKTDYATQIPKEIVWTRAQ